MRLFKVILAAFVAMLLTAGPGSAQTGKAGIPRSWYNSTDNTLATDAYVPNQAMIRAYIAAHGGGGSGDVTGPAGATSGNFPILDSTGKIISDSGKSITSFQVRPSSVLYCSQQTGAAAPSDAKLVAAYAAAGTTNPTRIVVDEAYTLSASRDWSANTNVTLDIQPNCPITLDSTTIRLNLGGPVIPYLYRLFVQTGTNYVNGVHFYGGTVPCVYPQWWGAVGVGYSGAIATLNTTAFNQAAHSGVPDGSNPAGMTIYVPPGGYGVNNSVSSQYGTTWIGAGKGNGGNAYYGGSQVYMMPGTQYPIFKADNASGEIKYSNLFIIGQALMSDANCIGIQSSGYDTIENCNFEGFQKGIVMSNNVYFRHNRVWGCYYGLYADNGGWDSFIQDNEFPACTYAIYGSSYAGDLITGNIIYHSDGVPGEAGMYFTGSPSKTVIQGNRFDNYSYGIRVSNYGTGAYGPQILANAFSLCPYGVALYGCYNALVKDNKFDACNIEIYDYNCCNCIFTNNVSTDSRLKMEVWLNVFIDSSSMSYFADNMRTDLTEYKLYERDKIAHYSVYANLYLTESSKWKMIGRENMNVTGVVGLPIGKSSEMLFCSSRTTLDFTGSDLSGYTADIVPVPGSTAIFKCVSTGNTQVQYNQFGRAYLATGTGSLGAEKITNGDFYPSFGSNALTNSDFATDTVWTKGTHTHWAITAGHAAHTPGAWDAGFDATHQPYGEPLSQAVTLTANAYYAVKMQTNYNPPYGCLRIVVGGTEAGYAHMKIQESDHYWFVKATDTTGIFLYPDRISNANLASVYLYPVNTTVPSWTGTGTDWVLDPVNRKITHNVGNTTTLWQNASVVTGTYHCVVKVSGCTAGNITLTVGGVAGPAAITRNGFTYQEVVVTATNTNFVITPSTDFNGSVEVASCRVIN